MNGGFQQPIRRLSDPPRRGPNQAVLEQRDQIAYLRSQLEDYKTKSEKNVKARTKEINAHAKTVLALKEESAATKAFIEGSNLFGKLAGCLQLFFGVLVAYAFYLRSQPTAPDDPRFEYFIWGLCIFVFVLTTFFQFKARRKKSVARKSAPSSRT